MMRRTLAAMLLAASAVLSSDLVAQTPPRTTTTLGPLSEARLEPGDIIRITVWRKPEFSGEFTIDANGAPRHPLYKQVPVAGMPVAEAERRLVEFLRGYEATPQIVIEPLFRVTVGGEVTTPNLYTLPRETTILQAIALAGGPTDRGRLNKVRIIRGGQAIEADLTQPSGDWSQRRVQSGDQILVSRRRNVFAEVVGPVSAILGAALAAVNLTRK